MSSAYYESSQWTGPGQAASAWEHQTPPPARSGASSAIPREEPAAFIHQFEEVDRAIDNLLKSGKMFTGMPGGRRESLPYPCPARMHPPVFNGRAGPGPRPHSAADYGEARGPPSNLQNFYANQRHQSSRGSNEAEQMLQAKRRMAAQRERELRNYHQEQQYNRTVLSGIGYSNKAERALSPGTMSEEERRKLIAQQRSALYGEGSLSEAGSFVSESAAASRGGPPTVQTVPAGLRGHSPLAYEYGRTSSVHPEAGSQPPAEGGQGSQSAGLNERSRANSNSSPQSNPPASKGAFDVSGPQQSSRTSASSPGGSPPRQSMSGSKSGQGSVAPIGTRPSVSGASGNPAPLPSPLSQGYTAPGKDDGSNASATNASNPSSAAPVEGSNVGLSGWGARPGGWGNKPTLGVQASVWG